MKKKKKNSLSLFLSQAVFEANSSRKLSSLKHRLVVMPASMRSGGGGGAGVGAAAGGGNGNASAENSVGATVAGNASGGGADDDEGGSAAAATAAAAAAAAPGTQQQQQTQQQPQRQRSLGPTPSPSPAPPPIPRAPHLLAFPNGGGCDGGNNNGGSSSASLRAPSVLYWSWAFEAPHNVKIVVRRQLGDDRAPQGELMFFLSFGFFSKRFCEEKTTTKSSLFSFLDFPSFFISLQATSASCSSRSSTTPWPRAPT